MKKLYIPLLFLFVFSCVSPKLPNKQTPSCDTICQTTITTLDTTGIITLDTPTVCSKEVFDEVSSPMPEPKHNFPVKKTKTKSNIRESSTGKLYTPKSTDATVFYNVPDTMECYKLAVVKVRISKAKDITPFTDDIKSGTTTYAKIPTSKETTVKIVDPTSSFTIISSNQNTQAVENDTSVYTEWIFNITPNKPGDKPLSIVVSVNNREIVWTDTISVHTNRKEDIMIFVSSEYKWLYSTFLAPIIFAIWQIWKKRKEKASLK